MAMPGIVTYEVTDTTHIAITFSEPLDPATAAVLSNYVIDRRPRPSACNSTARR